MILVLMTLLTGLAFGQVPQEVKTKRCELPIEIVMVEGVKSKNYILKVKYLEEEVRAFEFYYNKTLKKWFKSEACVEINE